MAWTQQNLLFTCYSPCQINLTSTAVTSLSKLDFPQDDFLTFFLGLFVFPLVLVFFQSSGHSLLVCDYQCGSFFSSGFLLLPVSFMWIKSKEFYLFPFLVLYRTTRGLTYSTYSVKDGRVDEQRESRGMLTTACNTSTLRWRQEDDKFKPHWAIYRDPVSNKIITRLEIYLSKKALLGSVPSAESKRKNDRSMDHIHRD